MMAVVMTLHYCLTHAGEQAGLARETVPVGGVCNSLLTHLREETGQIPGGSPGVQDGDREDSEPTVLIVTCDLVVQGGLK